MEHLVFRRESEYRQCDKYLVQGKNAISEVANNYFLFHISFPSYSLNSFVAQI
jgi:hypothetical protein